MKLLMALFLLAIVLALFLAGLLMLRGGPHRPPRKASMFHALALRVALSVSLFLIILLAHHLGWIKPTGLPLGASRAGHVQYTTT